MAGDEFDDIRQFEAKDTAERLPWGWLALLFGLILWGVYYAWAYTPPRWSQAAAYENEGAAVASSGTNILATVFFTAIAIAVAVALLVAVSHRKRPPKGG